VSTGPASFNVKRFGAVALLAVLLLAGVLWIAWASVAVSTLQARTAQQEQQLDQLIERSRNMVLRQGGESGEETIRVYFDGDTPAIAGAEVQHAVDEIVDKAGGRVVESQVLPVDQSEDVAHRIDLRASFEADIDALQSALFDIETHLPMMLIRSMSIRSFVRRGGGDADEENPILQVTLVVSGYWTSEAG